MTVINSNASAGYNITSYEPLVSSNKNKELSRSFKINRRIINEEVSEELLNKTLGEENFDDIYYTGVYEPIDPNVLTEEQLRFIEYYCSTCGIDSFLLNNNHAREIYILTKDNLGDLTTEELRNKARLLRLMANNGNQEDTMYQATFDMYTQLLDEISDLAGKSANLKVLDTSTLESFVVSKKEKSYDELDLSKDLHKYWNNFFGNKNFIVKLEQTVTTSKDLDLTNPNLLFLFAESTKIVAKYPDIFNYEESALNWLNDNQKKLFGWHFVAKVQSHTNDLIVKETLKENFSGSLKDDELSKLYTSLSSSYRFMTLVSKHIEEQTNIL